MTRVGVFTPGPWAGQATRRMNCGVLRAPTIAMLLMTGVFSAATAQHAAPDASQDAANVTSDTQAYCLQLAGRIEASGEMPPLARALWLEGRGMCERGQVRGGLARLRRAMMIVHGGDNH